MRVCVASAGRFHAFDLARQLQRDGHLQRLYTAYPAMKVDPDLRSRAATFPWLLAPYMTADRLGLGRVRDWLQWPAVNTFDRWVADRLVDCDVLVALSSYGLATYRPAREMGALCVCDRGSAHILEQQRLDTEEYARYGLPPPPYDARVVAKELAEYEQADLVCVPSQFAYDSFVARGIPPTRLAKLPYGVDLSLFRPVPKRDDVFRVLYVGRLSVPKGIRDLLEALASLKLPNFELVLVGGLEKVVKPLLARFEGGFRYLGFIPRTRLAQVYSQASVLVLPSIQEGLALVQAQAMACGVPVVATTNTGAADLFTDGKEGYIVPIRDPHALRESVLHLYQHPDVRARMAQAALERVQTLGGWDAYGQAAADLYTHQLERRTAVGRA